MITTIDISAEHPAYEGHFPGNPVLPGVILIDATLHAIANLIGVPLNQCCLTSIKFLNVVRPGQALTLQFQHEPPSTFRFAIVAHGQTAAKGLFSIDTQKKYAS